MTMSSAISRIMMKYGNILKTIHANGCSKNGDMNKSIVGGGALDAPVFRKIDCKRIKLTASFHENVRSRMRSDILT